MQLLEVVCDASNGLVSLATQLARSSAEVLGREGTLLLSRIRKTFVPTPDHGVGSAQESYRAFDSGFRPTQLVFDRRRKQNKQPRCIRTERGNHLVRVDTIAETLGHCFPLVGAFDSICNH